ncbi:Eukaryotic peptide chain release factor GTP-binding subunit [Tulasnella sp. 418]|nr:Eukaryotic peptide chain release factor GTP-binding subunit [Tulasnella sp. 418]
MTESVHKPPLPRIETHPNENGTHGTPVSRHARFAPSPPRSAPTQQSNNDAQAKQSSPSWSIFHWRRNPITIPSYLIPVFSGKNSKPLRNYKFHPSRNRYLFKGHLITGGDSAWPFVGALTVVLGIAGVWFGSTCVW